MRTNLIRIHPELTIEFDRIKRELGLSNLNNPQISKIAADRLKLLNCSNEIKKVNKKCLKIETKINL